MDSTRYVCLSRYGSEVDNVSWSADHRIAVTTPDTVFICTLQTSPPSHTPKPPTHKPTLVISTAHALPLSQKGGVATPRTLAEHIDPAFVQTSQSHDSFKRSDWSPSGCSKLGGCVLTALMAGGCLVVYTASPRGWRVWKHVLCLTDCLADAPQLRPPSSVGAALSTKCAAFAWHPYTLNGGGRGLVAMTTRLGQLVLVEVSLPVAESSDSVKVVWADALPGCGGGEVWGCGLKWSKCGKMLAVGCTDGQVFHVTWEALDTPPSTSPRITLLWPSDCVPVCHMTYLTRPPHLVCAKGSMLLVCSLDGGEPLTVCGHHTLPVSGVCSLDEAALLSSSLDGSLQVWEWAENQPRPLKTGVCVSGRTSIHGLATSLNGLLAAFSVNERMSQDKKQCSYLYFINLVTTEETMATVRHDTAGLSPWDMNECLRQIQLGSHSLHNYPHFERVVSTCHEGDPGLSALLALQSSLIHNQPLPQQIKAKQCVLFAHAQKCLDELTADSAILDAVSEQSVKLMLSWLSFFGASTKPNKVLALCSSQAEPTQPCPVCGQEVWLRDELLSYGCADGHCWDICPLSFQLVSACSECSVCVQCGCGVNTPTSLHTQNGSWLQHLLTQHTQCLYCGGYYESLC